MVEELKIDWRPFVHNKNKNRTHVLFFRSHKIRTHQSQICKKKCFIFFYLFYHIQSSSGVSRSNEKKKKKKTKSPAGYSWVNMCVGRDDDGVLVQNFGPACLLLKNLLSTFSHFSIFLWLCCFFFLSCPCFSFVRLCL